jgi:hypothetical protein
VLDLQAEHGYVGDLDIFWAWSLKLETPFPGSTDPQPSIYRDSGCNYPALGVLATAGVMSALRAAPGLEGLDRTEIQQLFRLVLSGVEVLWLLVVAVLVRRLLGSDGSLVVATLYLLPSTWAAGAVWGQIDLLLVSLTTLACSLFATSLLETSASWSKQTVLLTLAALASVATILTKPQAVVTLPWLAFLAILAFRACFTRLGPRSAIAAAVVAVAAGLAAFRLLDASLWALPTDSSGSLAQVWRTRADSASVLSEHGANLWALLDLTAHSSANWPLVGGLTPHVLGLGLAVGLVASLLLAFTAFLSRLPRTNTITQPLVARRALAHGLCGIGFAHLAADVALTGVHERYPAHAFPFLFLGTFALARLSCDRWYRRLFILVSCAAWLDGCFMYSILNPAAFRVLLPLRSQGFAACVLVLTLAVGLPAYLARLLRETLWTKRPAISG